MDENINSSLFEEENQNESIQVDLYNLQQNINDPYINFNEDIEMSYIINPLIFFYNFDNFKYYDFGKKVLAPKYMLTYLSTRPWLISYLTLLEMVK